MKTERINSSIHQDDEGVTIDMTLRGYKKS